jgi:hypothetical protein
MLSLFSLAKPSFVATDDVLIPWVCQENIKVEHETRQETNNGKSALFSIQMMGNYQ